jgi:hypothetical protein
VKGRQVERLAKRHLLPVMPGFLARGSLVYRPPTGHLLQAVSFDTSAFTSDIIFVTAFVQPLFQGHEYLTYSYGFRLGNDAWDVDQDDPDPTFASIAEEVQRSALPFFEQTADLDHFVALVPKWARERPRRVMQDHTMEDPVIIEDLACAAIVRGDAEAAAGLLRKAIAIETEDEFRNDEIVARLQSMLDLLEESGLESAQAHLDTRRAQTIKSLKL